MSKYLVNFYINNQSLQYDIDVLISNTSNNYLVNSIVPNDDHLLFPIEIENDNCVITSKFKGWTITHNGQEISSKTELKHGSYIKFRSSKCSYAILILDVNKVSLNIDCYKISNGQNVFIGRNPDSNIVIDTNDSISRKHAAIRIDNSGKCYIEDVSRNAGVYLNNKKTISSELICGDIIEIMGNIICFFDDYIIIPNNVVTNQLTKLDGFELLQPMEKEEENEYTRTPRILKSLSEGKITIDAPSQRQKSKQIPFILAAGPSATMALGMMASFGVTLSNAINNGNFSSCITSGVMVVSMMLGALMWPSLTRNYNKRQELANEKYRREKYGNYLLGIENDIKKMYERNTRIWNENILPNIDTISKIIQERSINLWEKVYTDDDFLEVRLGVGTRPFETEIEVPPKGFSLYDDPLIEQAEKLANKYKNLNNVPVSVSLLKKHTVGLIGNSSNIENTVRCMIFNIAALHSPEDVKICVICNELQKEKIEWVKGLPHCWSSSRDIRYFAKDSIEAYRLLNDLDENIQEREELLSKGQARIPHYVVIVLDKTIVENIPFYRYLTNCNNTVGVSAIFVGEQFNHIPKECETIIQNEDNLCGVYIKNENKNRFMKFVADELNIDKAKTLSQSIAAIPIKVEKSQLSVPSKISFLDMYSVGNVDSLNIEQKWDNNISDKSLAAPLGVKAGGELFYLDIHEKYHGCHGLVAGMTGSGKSEFLQAYILSAMINYSPNEIAFVLVDFKGGDMARPFLKTPHLSATISNLSGNILYRALVSLEAEVKYRQKIFNSSAQKLGIDKIDVNSYHKYYKEGKLDIALPHLVIVIDEFAQLKSQQPEFMSKLVEIAQVGRSLGIHLILATQKPSGVVDPQIWSNSRFKVCLKVSDKQDSVEMINRPEAALIKSPGRAYVQIGYDEIFEQIQSGYSGADYIPQNEYTSDEDITVKMIDSAALPIRTAKYVVGGEKSGKTQLEEVVSKIVAIGQKKHIQAKPLWLEPLSNKILLEECHQTVEFNVENWDRDNDITAICGMIDILETQEQIPFEIPIASTGHIAIYGASGSGKTTLLQSIILSLVCKYSPEMLNIFAMDFGGRNLANLRMLPHCVNVAFGDEEEKISYMFEQILECIEQRKVLFSKHNCSTYEAYLLATKSKLPAIVLVLDNYAVFRDKMFAHEEDIIRIAANAKSYGIYLIVTGNSKNAIYYKVSEHITNNILLKMHDRMDYRDILNVSIPIEPDNIKGRGLVVNNKTAVEFQAALPIDAENEAERMDKIIHLYTKMNNHYDGGKVSNLYTGYNEEKSTNNGKQALEKKPSKANKKSPSVLPPVFDDTHSFILGTSTISGNLQGFKMSDVYKIFIGLNEAVYPYRLIERLYSLGNSYIFDTMPTASNEHCMGIKTANEIHIMIEKLEQLIKDRSIELDLIKDANLSDDEIYGYMQKFERNIIIIRDFSKFYDEITDADLKTFLQLIKGIKHLGIYIVTLGNLNDLTPYQDTGLYIELVKVSQGMIIGGNVNNSIVSKLCSDISEIPVAERSKMLYENQAFMFDKSKYSIIAID